MVKPNFIRIFTCNKKREIMYILRKSSTYYELFIDTMVTSKGTFKQVNKSLDAIVKLLPPGILYNEDGSIFIEN